MKQEVGDAEKIITPKLTERELNLARLCSMGYNNKEIGYILGLMSNTVRVYLVHLYKRFDFKYGNPRVRVSNWYVENYGYARDTGKCALKKSLGAK